MITNNLNEYEVLNIIESSKTPAQVVYKGVDA